MEINHSVRRALPEQGAPLSHGILAKSDDVVGKDAIGLRSRKSRRMKINDARGRTVPKQRVDRAAASDRVAYSYLIVSVDGIGRRIAGPRGIQIDQAVGSAVPRERVRIAAGRRSSAFSYLAIA